MIRKSQSNLKTRTWQPKPVDNRRPFIEHLHELRKRAIYVATSVLVFGTLAYFVQQSIVGFLLKPARGQRFIYTSPGGGISFLFEVCTDVGLVLSLPVIVYQLLRFLEPLLDTQTHRLILRSAMVSALLGALGVAFGYQLGLPLALHFLGHQFTTTQIVPLFTISEYMSFVTIYLAGSALLFQLPLILVIINRIKPLSPRRLFKAERWVIAAAFIIAMLMAPTVNIIDQLVIAGPIILAYQVGIVLIWWTNRRSHRPKHVETLLAQDRVKQQQRQQRACTAVRTSNAAQVPPRPTCQPQYAVRPVRRKPITDFDFVKRRPIVVPRTLARP